MSSSTTTALSRQPLVQVLRNITDPRDRRGVRHDLLTVLSLAVTGVLAGCRSLTAIWEHATDLTAADLEALGLAAGQALASESTIRRVLQDLDPADVDAHLRSWLCTRTGTIEGRTVIAVDGKTMRGARTSKDPAPHLLSALDHATGAVLTQQRVAGKSNEIPALRELLEPLDLEGVVVSADAMHTQTGTARWITRRGGHYLLTPLGNQKILRKALKALPWKNVPSTSWIDTSHGRRVRRTVKAVEAPAWVDFPAAAQVVQLRRTRTIKSRKHVEVVYPGLLPPYDRCPARGRRRLDPRALGNREPAPRRSETSSSTRTATSYAPLTAHRSWPPCATWPPGLIRLFHSAGTSIASTTRSLSRQPKQAIKLLTQTGVRGVSRTGGVFLPVSR
ncbi:ISAs1 family transposase [Actinomyces oris]|uniref:ISAs1 family transposase n=1 Tax=Actinomyces oris TaxID=544580 RepID=UPI000B11AA2B|nr:ISAs1 family transposase [Actinomyces oris]